MLIDDYKKSIDTINTNYAKLIADKTWGSEDINLIKTSLDDIKLVTPKIKIPHTAENIHNITYVVKTGKLDWIKDTNEGLEFEISSIQGIYRITILNHTYISYSDKLFNISGTTTLLDKVKFIIIPIPNLAYHLNSINNTAMFIIEKNSENNTLIQFKITHPDLIRQTVYYTLEYVSNIPT